MKNDGSEIFIFTNDTSRCVLVWRVFTRHRVKRMELKKAANRKLAVGWKKNVRWEWKETQLSFSHSQLIGTLPIHLDVGKFSSVKAFHCSLYCSAFKHSLHFPNVDNSSLFPFLTFSLFCFPFIPANRGEPISSAVLCCYIHQMMYWFVYFASKFIRLAPSEHIHRV